MSAPTAPRRPAPPTGGGAAPDQPEPARERHLAELVRDYPDAHAALEHDPEYPLAGDWILVELYRSSGERWFTAHPSPEAAADYHDTQPNPELWQALELADLTTGRRYKGATKTVVVTTWEGLA